MSIPFETPTTVSLAGPTQSGKSYWIRDLIKHGDKMFKQTPEKIVYCYTAWQTMFEAMKGLPSQVNLEEWSNGHMLLVLDDIMKEACSSKEVMSLLLYIATIKTFVYYFFLRIYFHRENVHAPYLLTVII